MQVLVLGSGDGFHAGLQRRGRELVLEVLLLVVWGCSLDAEGRQGSNTQDQLYSV